MNNYPLLTSQAAQQIASHRLETASVLEDLHLADPTADVIEHQSSIEVAGPEQDMGVHDILTRCQAKIDSIASNAGTLEVTDVHEGQAAVLLYDCITNACVPMHVLDDHRFWTHLSVTYLWNFTTRRQSQAFLKHLDTHQSVAEAPGGAATSTERSATPGYMRYIDGNNSRHCVAARMYLRMKCLGGGDEAELAYAVKRGADFWQSHILRVKQGEHPGIVRAMVRRQANDDTYLETEPLREFAKWLNLESRNLELGFLDPTEQEALVERLWRRALDYQAKFKS